MNESNDFEKLYKFLKPSILQAICSTLIFLGPIGWLFFSISINDYHRILLLSGLSIVSSVLITVNWFLFFKERKLYKAANEYNNKSRESCNK